MPNDARIDKLGHQIANRHVLRAVKLVWDHEQGVFMTRMRAKLDLKSAQIPDHSSPQLRDLCGKCGFSGGAQELPGQAPKNRVGSVFDICWITFAKVKLGGTPIRPRVDHLCKQVANLYRDLCGLDVQDVPVLR